MANRTIQQKIVKMKRMRRAHLKRFSTKNTGPIKYPGFFNDQGDFVDMSMRSRAKAAEVQNLDEKLSINLRRRFRFKLTDPESIYARSRGLHTDLTKDGEMILAKMVQSRSGPGSIQGEQRYVHQVMEQDEHHKLVLYMSGDDNFFVQQSRDALLISFRYYDRMKAVKAFKDKGILWEEIIREDGSETSASV